MDLSRQRHPKGCRIRGLYREDSGPVLTVSLRVRHCVATAGSRSHLCPHGGDGVTATPIEGEDAEEMNFVHGADEIMSFIDKIWGAGNLFLFLLTAICGADLTIWSYANEIYLKYFHSWARVKNAHMPHTVNCTAWRIVRKGVWCSRRLTVAHNIIAVSVTVVRLLHHTPLRQSQQCIHCCDWGHSDHYKNDTGMAAKTRGHSVHCSLQHYCCKHYDRDRDEDIAT